MDLYKLPVENVSYDVGDPVSFFKKFELLLVKPFFLEQGGIG